MDFIIPIAIGISLGIVTAIADNIYNGIDYVKKKFNQIGL